MDTYKHRYLDLKSRWREYHQMQEQLRKDRWIVYIGSCLMCLFAGFMAGYITAYPKQHTLVVLEIRPTPEVQTTRL